jgi:putative addiction module component (TIGR02574 family)
VNFFKTHDVSWSAEMTVSEIPLDQLKSELQQLDGAVRAELAEFLIHSLGAPEDTRTDEEFEAELDRRVEEMRSGKVPGIPAHEVIAEIREKYS